MIGSQVDVYPEHWMKQQINIVSSIIEISSTILIEPDQFLENENARSYEL